MDDLLREFLTETGESLDIVDRELVRFEQEPNNTKILDNIFRLVHTVKGTCGFLSLPRLEALTHAAEALLGRFRSGKPVTGEAVTLVLATLDRIKSLLEELERNAVEASGVDEDLIEALQAMALEGPAGKTTPQVHQQLPVAHQSAHTPAADMRPARSIQADSAAPEDEAMKLANKSIRVHVDTLEHLMTMVSELVLTRNQLLEIVGRNQDSEFKLPLQRLSHVTADLQKSVLKARMQPIGYAWQRLPRIVRDLSSELAKPIEIEMGGAQTELDRQVLELIKDPLTHLIRNSADHGIEPPGERLAAGKPGRGLIRLSAGHEGGHVVIEVADDGRGLDTDRIKAKAIGLGMIPEGDADKLSQSQLQRLIFAPAFSTAEQVTSVSGRGVGMDVVHANIDQIGGTVDVRSVPGSGTTFSIKIPLTLAIISALIVDAGGQRFAIPQLAVLEIVRVCGRSDKRIERIRDAPWLRLRHALLPLVDIKHVLKLRSLPDDENEPRFIVIMQSGSVRFGVIVDHAFHTEEIVVKPLSRGLRHVAMFSGATILGDGSVILIANPSGMVPSPAASQAPQRPTEPESRLEVEETRQSFLLFRAGSLIPKALPLGFVRRLEEIDAASLERTGERTLLPYRGQLLPLIAVDEDRPIRTTGTLRIVVLSCESRWMGLIVDQIINIVEAQLDLGPATFRPGILGCTVLHGQPIEIVDIAHYLSLVFEDWCTGTTPSCGAVQGSPVVDTSASVVLALKPLPLHPSDRAA
ncbi:MAG: chemotaxis protein CheW [Xanthobacteraceae bacterium]